MDRLEKLENLQMFISSSTAFVRYLESNGDINDIGKDYCDLNYLKVITASFYLFLHKENIIEKDEEGIKSKIIKDQLEYYGKIIAQKNEDGSWSLGSAIVDNIEDLINIVRNKLAHGDFKIITENNMVEFEHNDQRFSIEIDKLVEFTNQLCHYWELSKETGENVRTLIVDILDKSINNIKGKSKYEKALNSIYIIEIKNRPMVWYKRKTEDSYLIEELITKINEKIKKKESYQNCYLAYKDELLKRGIELEIVVYKASELSDDKKEQLDKIYYNNLKYFKLYPYAIQINVLVHWVYEVVKAKETKRNLSFACHSNQVMFRELEECSNLKPFDIIEKSHNKVNMWNYYTQQTVCNYLLAFYTIYQFGLDTIYKNSESDMLKDIVDFNKFNFANLDLSLLNPTINIIEHDSTCYNDQLNKKEKDYISKLNEYCKKRECFSNYYIKQRESGKSQEELESETTLNKILDLAINEFLKSEEVYDDYLKSKKFMDKYYDKHIINREIITHIRNAIAHGNVELNIYSEDYNTDNDTFVFRDIYEGELTFELTVPIRDFISLFSTKNLNVLYDFINLQRGREKSKVKTKSSR